MAIYCPDCDKERFHVCDFCIYYYFNKDQHGPIYINKGCCGLHFLRCDPGDGCEYYHCFLALQ